MKLEEVLGIYKSLFSKTAKIPSTKNNNAGFVRFSKSRLKSIAPLSPI